MGLSFFAQRCGVDSRDEKPAARARCALVQGDNLEVLKRLRAELSGGVALAYLDPPFFTQREHLMTDGRVAFDDRWSSLGAYLATLRPRLKCVRELLAPHGSVVVHLNWRASHHAKVMLDEIFGEDAFASEIVWRYRRWPTKTTNFQRVHDVLLRYRKDPTVEPRWNQLYEPLAASTMATWGSAKQRAVVGQNGKRLRSSKTDEESKGVPLGDVWDIGVVAPVARERTGFPTQKPEALLERLVLALTNPDDMVLDPYVGSGTSVTVAARLGRPAIGIDASPIAITVAEGRLRASGIEVEVWP